MIRRISLKIVTCLIFFSAISFGQTKEYIVKAAMIEKILKFVEWPEEKRDKENFVITVAGENPFGNVLEKVFKDKKIDGRSIEIIYTEDVKIIPFDKTDLLFLPEKIKKSQNRVIKDIGRKKILTISDFGEDGECILNFLIDKGKVRFTVNLKAGEKSGIYISSLLLNLAYKVYK